MKRVSITLELFTAIILFSFFGLSLAGEEIAVKEIKNLGQNVNTGGDEFFPSITTDGMTMVFNLRPPGGKNSNIYITQFKNGNWTKPEPIAEINSEKNDETPFISPDGSMIIFASNRAGSLKPPVTENNTQYYTEDLYISRKTDSGWSKPKRIKGDVNSIQNERAPSLSQDGKTLYFSRWPLDSIEKSKILSATLADDGFKDVRELPYPVNSSYSDYGFMPSKNKPGFYFSSNRRGGYGLWDIYFVPFQDGAFLDIINLGPTINSEDNELSLTELGDKIFFCSNRQGGQGLFDIYEIMLPQTITELAKTTCSIKVLDKSTGQPVSLDLSIQTVNPDEKESTDKNIMKGTTDDKGSLVVSWEHNVRWIIIKSSTEEIESFTREVKLIPGKTVDVVLLVSQRKKLEKVSYSFPVIYFDLGSSEIKFEYLPLLHDMIDYLRKHPSVRVKITGFADRIGTYYRNVDLSLKRSMKIRDYLVLMGLDDTRFEVTGEGYHSPIFNIYGVESDNLSRRVLFTTIK